MNEPPSLIVLLERIRGRLDGLATAPLSDEDLTHLVAVDEWLEALTEPPSTDPGAEFERELEEAVEDV